MKRIIYIIIAILTLTACTCTPKTEIINKDYEIIRQVTLYVTSDGVCKTASNAYFNLKAKSNADFPATVDVSYYFDSDDYAMNKVIVNEWPMYKGTLESVTLKSRNYYHDGVYYTVEDDEGIRIAIIRADIGLDKIIHYEEAYSNTILRDMIVVSFDRELNKSLIDEEL